MILNLITGNSSICYGSLNGCFVEVWMNSKLHKTGLGKSTVVHRSLFWFLLIWSTSFHLVLLLRHHLSSGQMFLAFFFTSQFQTDLLASVLLFLYIQKKKNKPHYSTIKNNNNNNNNNQNCNT